MKTSCHLDRRRVTKREKKINLQGFEQECKWKNIEMKEIFFFHQTKWMHKVLEKVDNGMN